MNLKLHIHKIKCIDDLEVELPLERGLYAITGQNGSGKSTLVTCASSSFFIMRIVDYFGETPNDSSISFELDGGIKKYTKEINQNGKYVWKSSSDQNFKLKGFIEGSLIYGNRFRNTSLTVLRKFNKVSPSNLTPADIFIRESLGFILQGDKNYFEKLWYYENEEFKGPIFYYEKNGKRISQFYMSTGENLLISILHSLKKKIDDRKDESTPCLILLDEIELALHPASLKRLASMLQQIADQYNFAIYFSTHSLELIELIKPDNIFYVNRHIDNSYEIINPCYPAYATRTLYDHDGYDKVFLVEDDLAKEIISQIARREKLLNHKMVHVLPCGGFSNVIDLAYDVVSSNLLTKKASVAMILDRDVEERAKRQVKNKVKNFNVPLNFLPVQSLEKYLMARLVENVDHILHRELNDYLFTRKSLDEIIIEYRSSLDFNKDNDGKKLFKRMEENLKECGKTRADLISIVLDHIFDHDQTSIDEIKTFLSDQLS